MHIVFWFRCFHLHNRESIDIYTSWTSTVLAHMYKTWTFQWTAKGIIFSCFIYFNSAIFQTEIEFTEDQIEGNLFTKESLLLIQLSKVVFIIYLVTDGGIGGLRLHYNKNFSLWNVICLLNILPPSELQSKLFLKYYSKVLIFTSVEPYPF